MPAAARILLGLLLLATAALKADIFLERSSPAYAVFGSLRLQVAAIICSTALGLWLLSGRKAGAAWAVATGYFVLLAGASFAMGVQERPTCGCFGRLPVNPWLAFAIDLAAIVVLMVLPPAGGWSGIGKSLLPARVVPRMGHLAAAIVLLVAASGVLAGFGGPSAAMWFLRGEPIAVEQDKNVLHGEPREERFVTVSLTNRGPLPVTIFGATLECGIRAIDDLPLTIQPGETVRPKVWVYFREEPEVYYRYGKFYTDAPEQPEVKFWVAIRAVGKEE
jgi:hypothetical protein